MAEFIKSEFVERIANEVIDKYNDKFGFINELGVRIAYMESDLKKRSQGGIVHADCEKVKDKNKMFIPYDFIITVYSKNCEGMTVNQMKLLLYHELMHVGIKLSDAGVKYYIVPHNIQDFKEITSKYGEYWSEEGMDIPDICE